MYNKPLSTQPRWRRVLRTVLLSLLPPLVLAGVVGLVFWVRTGSTFQLREWRIQGDLFSARQGMVQILARHKGMALSAIQVDKLRAELAQDPWITGISVVKNWPDALDIRVREAEPLAWMIRRGSVKVLCTDGHLRPASRAPLSLDLPVLKAGDEQLAAACPALLTLKRDFPELYGKVERLDWAYFPQMALGASSTRITLQSALWRHGLSLLQIVQVSRPELLARGGELDLRFVNQVVWRRANA